MTCSLCSQGLPMSGGGSRSGKKVCAHEMKKDVLLKIAKQLKIKGAYKLKKEDLIKSIEAQVN